MTNNDRRAVGFLLWRVGVVICSCTLVIVELAPLEWRAVFGVVIGMMAMLISGLIEIENIEF